MEFKQDAEKFEHVEHLDVEDRDEVIDHAPLDRIDSQEQHWIEERFHDFTPEQQKKIIHRIDRRLVLTLGFM